MQALIRLLAARNVDWERLVQVLRRAGTVLMNLRDFWSRLDAREQKRLRKFLGDLRDDPRHVAKLADKDRKEIIRILRKGARV